MNSQNISARLYRWSGLLSLIVLQARAELLVYEGFNYGTAAIDRVGAELLHGQPDGIGGDEDAIGLAGTWEDSSGPGAASDFFLQLGSLEFGNLATSGNSVRTDTNANNDVFSRGVISNLSATGSGELWISFTANKLQNNFSAAEGGVVIGNGVLVNPRLLANDGTDGLIGFGIGPTTEGNNWTAYAWDGTEQIAGEDFLPVAVDGSETNLLIGRIDYNSGAAGADVFSLYSYVLSGGTIEGGSLNFITSLEVDADESRLDTLNLTRQVNTHYDEIRIGESLEDVLAIGVDPSGLAITSISLVQDDVFELTLVGNPDTNYEIVSSDSLDFSAGSLVVDISQGSGSDPGTIGGVDNSLIMTDGNGDATVQLTLTSRPRGFLRARRLEVAAE